MSTFLTGFTINPAATLQAYDTINVTTGVRTVKWSGDTGMSINGERVKLRGFCDHSNFGGVGGAVPDRVNLFRAQVGEPCPCPYPTPASALNVMASANPNTNPELGWVGSSQTESTSSSVQLRLLCCHTTNLPRFPTVPHWRTPPFHQLLPLTHTCVAGSGWE